MAGMISNLPGYRGSRAAVNKRRVSPSPQPMLPGLGRTAPLPGPTRNIPRTKTAQRLPKMQKMNRDPIMGGAQPTAKKLTTKAADAGASAAKLGKMSLPSKLGIGAGLGIAAGVMMNRRGAGASSGRQSIYNY